MKFKTKMYLALLVIIILSGCEKIDIGESFICRVGDKIRITNNLSFSIQSVLEWRCPTDMICLHSGDVDVSLRFHQPFHRTDTVICLYSNGRNPIEFSGYIFKLLGVEPLPISDVTVSQEDFRIEMMVLEN